MKTEGQKLESGFRISTAKGHNGSPWPMATKF